MLEQQVVDQVRVVSREKPVTDGISCDAVGNLWLTTVEHSSLSVAVPVSGDGEWGKAGLGSESEVAVSQGFRIVKVIENRQLLRWPDGRGSRYHRITAIISPDLSFLTQQHFRPELRTGRPVYRSLCPPAQTGPPFLSLIVQFLAGVVFPADEHQRVRPLPHPATLPQAAAEGAPGPAPQEEVQPARCGTLEIAAT